MFTFNRFHSDHLKCLAPQALQRMDHAMLLRPDYAKILDANFGMSAWSGSICVAASGVVPVFNHRAVAWAILSNEASPFMLRIVRKIRSMFYVLPYRRVEIAVRSDFFEGHRFARLLGMVLETPQPMQAHGADGCDEHLYAWVKP